MPLLFQLFVSGNQSSQPAKASKYCAVLWEQNSESSSSCMFRNSHCCLQWCPLLGSKDLGFYVFRTLICIVGKPWSKQCI